MKKEHIIIILAVMICVSASILFFMQKKTTQEPEVSSLETSVLEGRDRAFVKVTEFLTNDCLEGEKDGCLAKKSAVTIDDAKIKKALSIADFDISNKLDTTRYETWTSDPSNDTQGVRLKLVPDNYVETNRTDRYSLKVMYDAETALPVANGVWIRLPGVHVSNYDYFSFWIKGDPRIGHTRIFSIGFLNGDGELYVYRIEDVIPAWRRYGIKLKYTKGKSPLNNLMKIYFIFNTATITKEKGILYFDHLEFLQKG